jgi:Icc protein
MQPFEMNPEQNSVIRIAQISDCHVAADSDAPYRDQNADENLARIVQAVRQWRPRLVMVTGDVSEDGSRESYQRTSSLLSQIGAPVMALPGNHDEAALMSRYFPAGPWDGPYEKEIGNWQLVLLDSTVSGQVSGAFGPRMLQQLQQTLSRSDRPYRLLALHHQPVPVGASWIDRYRLESPQQFLRVAEQTADTRCIVWGHVHHDFRLERKGCLLLGAPSSVANSLPGTERFSLDPSGPSCRWLELSPDGRVDTGILYPPESVVTVADQADGSSNHRIT